MRSSVKLSYNVMLYPDDTDDEAISFSFYPQKKGNNTVEFELPFAGSEAAPIYVGFHDEKCWFIDTNNQRGIFLESPLDISETADDLSLIDDYEEEVCMVIAKCIEVICNEFFGYLVDCSDLPF